MQKTLLALAILSFAAAASAAPDSQETPLHPIKDGRYTVTTGYRYNNQKGNDGGKADNIDLYAGYLYSPSGFKQGGLRVGIGLSYTYSDSNARAHRTTHAPNLVDDDSSSLYLRAQVEYEQDLGGGWSITPWGEASVSLRDRTETKWSQAYPHVPDETHKGSSYGISLGVDAQKQLGQNMALTFGPYYSYAHSKTNARDHAGVHFDSSSGRAHAFGIRAGLRF